MKSWIYAGHALIGRKFVPDTWVSFEDGKIVSVSQNSFEWEPEEGEIFARSREGYLIPGLIDTHVHLTRFDDGKHKYRSMVDLFEPAGRQSLKALKHAQQHLRAGVTTVRDLGSSDLGDILARDAINAGEFEGARIVAGGHALTATGGHMDASRYRPGIPYEGFSFMGYPVDGVAEARRCVRQCIKEGSDVIKVNISTGANAAPEMMADELQAIIEIAHQRERKVCGHSQGKLGVDWALDAGIDSLEHGRFISDEQFERMARQGTFLTPTLTPDTYPPNFDHLEEPGASWLKGALKVMYPAVLRAYQHGVKVTCGSDASMEYIRHGMVAWEVEQLHKAGLPEIEALMGATEYAAENLGMEDRIGSIRENHYADFVMLKSDPLNDLDVLKKSEDFEFIMKEGCKVRC